MELRRLGSTGSRAGRLALGTLTWGRATDAEDARAQVAAFLESGGNLLHTADHFCAGQSQEMVGKAIAGLRARSDVMIVSSSGVSEDPRRPVDLTRRHLLAALDAALARMGVDHVDIWQVGPWDRATPVHETLGALEWAVASGRATYAAVGQCNAWQITRLASLADRSSAIALAGVAYSLLDRSAEAEVLPATDHAGIGLLAYSPAGLGVLTGKYRHATPPDSRGAAEATGRAIREFLGGRHRGIAEAVSAAADGLGVTPLEVALAWVADRPGVTSAVVGARSVLQLHAALRASELTLPEEISTALDEVSAPTAAGPDSVVG